MFTRENNNNVLVWVRRLTLVAVAGFLLGRFQGRALLLGFPLLFCFLDSAIALVFFLFLLPFSPALNLAPGIDMASSRFIIVLLFLFFVIQSLRQKRIRIINNPATIWVMAFCVWLCFSFLYSPSPERTARKILVFLTIAPVLFLVLAQIKKKGHFFRLKLFGAVALSGFFVSVVATASFFLQFWIGQEPIVDWGANVFGSFFWGNTVSEAVSNNLSWLVDVSGRDILRASLPFPDPHMLSFFLAFSLPAQLFFLLSSSDKKIKIFSFVAVLLGGFTEAITFSRGGYLGFLTALFLMAVLLVCKKRKESFLLILFLGTVLGVLFLGPAGLRLKSSFDLSEGSNRGRLTAWNQAISIYKEHLWKGVGLGAFSYKLNPETTYREPVYAHNLYLELLAETGTVGALLFVAMIVAQIKNLWQKIFSINKKEALFGACLLASLAWFLVHSFFEMPLYSPVILPLFFVFMGLSVGSKTKSAV